MKEVWQRDACVESLVREAFRPQSVRGVIIPAGIPGDGRGTNSPWHGYGALYKDGKVGIHPSAPMSPTLHILMGFGFKPEGPS